MANSKVTYREVRFLIEDNTLEVYVFCECPDFFPAHGWKHKSFPAEVSALDFMRLWNDAKEDPLLWTTVDGPTVYEYLQLPTFTGFGLDQAG